ncbi:MAG: SET domain-containing protein-lysine N-methyltransferase [Candidatus Adlerbacteria bacterium]|nr:SET domain-containing protein-lysine N-methyltransferase [Candidatus Adlerbacteria bacterium]
MKKIVRHFKAAPLALRVGRSRTGRGLFAGEDIPKGTCIIEYTGRPVLGQEQYTHRGKYLFETGKGTMIDGNTSTNTAKFINHSCKPNCEIDIRSRRIFVFALRRIKKDEELTYDYDEEYFDTYIKPKGCRCTACSPH